MIEYQVLEADTASSLTRQINGLAKSGWMVTQFSVARSGNYGEELFSVVMEKEPQ